MNREQAAETNTAKSSCSLMENSSHRVHRVEAFQPAKLACFVYCVFQQLIRPNLP